MIACAVLCCDVILYHLPFFNLRNYLVSVIEQTMDGNRKKSI